MQAILLFTYSKYSTTSIRNLTKIPIALIVLTIGHKFDKIAICKHDIHDLCTLYPYSNYIVRLF